MSSRAVFISSIALPMELFLIGRERPYCVQELKRLAPHVLMSNKDKWPSTGLMWQMGNKHTGTSKLC
jgi:hypothetical protein